LAAGGWGVPRWGCGDGPWGRLVVAPLSGLGFTGRLPRADARGSRCGALRAEEGSGRSWAADAEGGEDSFVCNSIRRGAGGRISDLKFQSSEWGSKRLGVGTPGSATRRPLRPRRLGHLPRRRRWRELGVQNDAPVGLGRGEMRGAVWLLRRPLQGRGFGGGVPGVAAADGLDPRLLTASLSG